MHHKNKRTLKKRIRRIISFTIFFTMFFFSFIVIFFIGELFKSEVKYVSEYINTALSTNMNSPLFCKQFGIQGLEEFNPDNLEEKQWLETLEIKNIPTLETDPKLQGKVSPPKYKGMVNLGDLDHPVSFLGIKLENLVYHKIILNRQVIFETSKQELSKLNAEFEEFAPPPKSDPTLDKLTKYFAGTETVSPLYSSNGTEIGNISTTLDTQFLIAIYLILAFSIGLVGLISIIIANIIGKILSLSVTFPILKLEEKIRALADEDFQSGADKQLVLKKPLREIEALATSTNLIMNKMKEYNQILESQKVLVENQNLELEAQNVELLDSKKELEAAQALLVQSENMASIGQLTAAITHEINTPLGAIHSNVQLYELLLNVLAESQEVNTNEELKEILEKMKETNVINTMACQRVIEIIKSLKTFSKLDQAEFQEANLTDSLKSVLILTSNLWKNKISIHEEYHDDPVVKCFPGLLNQVFMNIIVNSIQAIPEKGEIYIHTFKENNEMKISIRDTGVGISEENLSKIFDSGFSTKETGLGAGLGLSICKNIIHKHNGRIDVKSTPGEGSAFIISLPVF